ncbi:MAG TPA: hypothetical protein VGO47_12215, partial [Chlamydiales bacterium]|nr:hypothetical protein [Chlamydiales bacterium]
FTQPIHLLSSPSGDTERFFPLIPAEKNIIDELNLPLDVIERTIFLRRQHPYPRRPGVEYHGNNRETETPTGETTETESNTLSPQTTPTPKPRLDKKNLQVQMQTDKTDTQLGPNIPIFFGDYRLGESPQIWLQRFKTQTFVANYQEPKKIILFGMLMADGEEAGDWWEEVQESKEEEVRTMAGIMKLFNEKWPKPKKTGLEKEAKKWELTGLHIKPQDVGMTADYHGKQTLTHHILAFQALKLSKEVGDTSGLLIDTVRSNLPDAVRRAIANETFNNWQEFHDGLLRIRPVTLAETKRDAGLMEDLAQLLQQPRPTWAPQYYGRQTPITTPTSQPVGQLTPKTPAILPVTPGTQRTTTPRGPTISPVTQLGNRNQTPVRQPPSPMNPFYDQQSPYTPTPTYGLRRAEPTYDIWRPFPTYPIGQTAYTKAVEDWRKKYGGSRPTITNPFPLRPGGSFLDARECYQCGLKGHVSRECQEPEDRRIPIEERNWRADYAATMVAQRITEKQTQNIQIAAIEEVLEEQGNEEESTQ